MPRRSTLMSLGAAGLVAVGAGIVMSLAHGPGVGCSTSTVVSASQSSDPLKTAKAVVDKTPWDAGVIESPEEFEHAFVIRNEGGAPLTLRLGESTCSCTLTDVPDAPVPPGGQARVCMTFKDSAKEEKLKTGRLSRGVWVHTNDPTQEKILLGVEATVVRRLAAEPANLVLTFNAAGAPTEKARTASALIYTQTWDRFDLAVQRTSREGLRWRVEPAEKDRLAAVEARHGYRLDVILPSDMPEGDFSERVFLTAAPHGGKEKPRTLKVGIQGRVEGRLRISGPKVDAGGTLRLGPLSLGQSVQETVVLKVNDDLRTLSVRQVETRPAFLRVQMGPFQKGTEQHGLYRLNVEIRDAPSCNYSGSELGLIRLKTDHPRLKTIDVRVDFSVVSG